MSQLRPKYLGRVKRSPPRGESYRFATVEPLVESNSAGTEWLCPVRDAMSLFPRRGFVHWHEAPAGLKEGGLWQFAIDEHPSTERADRPERIQLEDPHEAIEVIDLRGWGNEGNLRSSLTGEGIHLTPAPLARRIMIWLESGVCVGPLLLKPGNAPGLFALDGPEAHRDANRMPVYQLAKTDINHVGIDGGRYFVSPKLDLGQSIGIQNWTSDQQVARSILDRLRKMDAGLVKALGMTDSVFREYLKRVEGGLMGTTDPAVERARADRLRGVLDAIHRDVELMAAAAQALFANETVQSEIEKRVEGEVQARILTRQSEIDAVMTTATEQVAQAQKDLETTLAKNAELETLVLAKQRELDEKATPFSDELTSRLAEIARRPEAFFAEMATIRAALAPFLAGGGHVRQRPHDPPPATPAGPQSAGLSDETQVRAALAAHAGKRSLSIHAMLGLHALFIAGLVPIVAGRRGYDLLRAYAMALAGGRLTWVSVGSSVIEPGDLLGRWDSASYRILPSSSGVLDVVSGAMKSGRLHILVLEGFNRAPVDAYLSPILESARAAREGDAVRTVRIANPSLLSEDDPYMNLAHLAWPPNVLIACQPSDGSLTLPVSHSMWRFFGWLDADDRDRAPMPFLSPGADSQSPTEIAQSLWNGLTTNSRGNPNQDSEVMARLAGRLSLSGADSVDALRVRDILCNNGLPMSDAIAFAAGATLIARSLAVPKTVEETMRAAGIAIIGWPTILAEAQRLRG